MRKDLLEKLVSQYIENVEGVLAVLIYNREELSLIDGFTATNYDESQTHIYYPYISKSIQNFGKEFGKDKDFLIIQEFNENRLAFCSLGSIFILITIAEKETSEIELKIYSIHLASEVEQSLERDLEKSSVMIPSILQIYSKVKKLRLSTEKLSLKIIVVGDYKTGKTSLIKRFTEKNFKVSWDSTVGFDVSKKILNIDGRIIMNLAIWDTGGFTSQISPTKEKIFKLADAAIIVIDKTDQSKLKTTKKWYNEIIKSIPYDLPIFLVVTKNDIILIDSQLGLKDIEDWSEKYDIDYFLVSAKTGENVEDLFFEIIYKIIGSKADNKSYESIEEIHKYKGYYLDPVEINAIKDLEHIIIERLNDQSKYLQILSKKVEEDGIPVIYEIDDDSFGIKIEDGNVLGLGLFNCYLNTLPESIVSLRFLKKLNLRCNQLIKLPDVITKLELLEGLDLALTDLTVLPESIGNLKTLKILHLENNSLTTLPNSIGYLEFLEELHLNNNPIKSLPNTICNLRTLKKLYLEAPVLFYKGVFKDLPNNFGNLIYLQELDLSSCELKNLPNSFGNLRSLRILDLYNNNLVSLPDTFGNLKMLEILNLENNKLKFLPNSLGDLSNLKQINVSRNPLQRKGSEKFKALALKSKGIKHDRLMQLAEICKQEEDLQKIEKSGISKRKLTNVLKPITYASVVALLGIITFLSVRFSSQTLNFAIVTIFIIAVFINFLIGTCIIATISSYFKVSTILFTQRIIKIFDIFVIFYLVWALRALIKIILSIELIPSINFLFEFAIPESMLNFLVQLGYNIDLTFLENLDLFFGHFFLKIFSIALVFWALYRNGIGHIRKTIFDEKANKNIWSFLIIGLFGALSLAIMKYSNLDPFLDIGYNIGVIIGSCLFIWEINKIKKAYFYYNLFLILGGILLIWLVSYWNIFYSLLISIILIVLYFIMRAWHHKRIKYYVY